MQIGCDKKTGHPFVQFKEDLFISLFPLTKIQIERFVWSGAAALSGLSAEYIARLERQVFTYQSDDLCFNEKAPSPSGNRTERVTKLMSRIPLPDITVEEALLATNISFISPGQTSVTQVPEASSDLHHILAWLGAVNGEGIRLLTSEEYGQLADMFSNSSSAYLEVVGTMSQDAGLDRVLKRAVRKLCELGRLDRQKGLPFIQCGCWELIQDIHEIDVFVGDETGTYRKPMVVGRSRFMPEFSQQDLCRAVLIEHHPVIGVRPLLLRRELLSVREYDTSQERVQVR